MSIGSSLVDGEIDALDESFVESVLSLKEKKI